MRDVKEIIEDMRKIVKVSMMNHLKKINIDGYGREDAQEFSEEFDYLLELAEKGADLAAGETRIKTVAGVIDDLERQMMMTGADSIDLSYTFEHKPYVFGVRLTMLEHDTAEVEGD